MRLVTVTKSGLAVTKSGLALSPRQHGTSRPVFRPCLYVCLRLDGPVCREGVPGDVLWCFMM